MAKIALIRPGAIGDILMAFNFVQDLKKKNSVVFFCSNGIYSILKNFTAKNNIVNLQPLENYKPENFDKTINLIGYPIKENYPSEEDYPYKRMSKHLLQYFAKEMDVEFSFDKFSLNLPTFPKKIKNRNYPRYITIQTKTGWSAYKEWWGWQDFIDLLKKNKPNIEIYQIGGPDDPEYKNIDGSFCGDSFEDNLAAQAWSYCHIGLDSVFNHTTNINWITKGKNKAIILFGSTQADASGYPHNYNISLNLHCQPCFKENPLFTRVPLGLCNNPPNQTYENPQHACMKGITPEMVYEYIQRFK